MAHFFSFEVSMQLGPVKSDTTRSNLDPAPFVEEGEIGDFNPSPTEQPGHSTNSQSTRPLGCCQSPAKALNSHY